MRWSTLGKAVLVILLLLAALWLLCSLGGGERVICEYAPPEGSAAP
jgi:hypothetical protein